ncbi:sensor histidine kinase [Parvularcula maris]|uniref:Histidine kinase n=1 Tax=Parvularcula maris TaxID=2965077 RepID=A0A9X2RJH3_9PROT|nr:histidine kinase [Parvularcula maris]MCQ8184728.1 histidine kinase [Parvularcula maris]
MSLFPNLPHSPALRSREGQYWISQVVGWAGLALLSYLSLTLWYNPGELVPAFHTILQSVLGLMVSHVLRLVSRWSWRKPLSLRVGVNILGVAMAALVWTALRLQTFTWLTGEVVNPGDWGGWFFASMMVFGSWLFCYHAVKFYRQAIEQRERAQQEKVKRLEAEALFRETKMRMLQYQLNPHFLFNALNSVTARVHRGDQKSAVLMLSRIGEFLRLSLEQDERLQHTLEEEEEMVCLYLEIEKARFGDRLVTHFRIDENASRAVVPTLLLQPLVENAIKHGVSLSLRTTTIEVVAERRGDRLHLCVRDDGSGNPSEGRVLASRREGIGLNNVEERLSSTYRGDFTLTYGPRTDQGFKVLIDVPFRELSFEEAGLEAAE